MTEPTLPKASPSGCHAGFSLIEMMWQLVILVVVSFPMVMALNLQKQVLEGDISDTKNQTQLNSLFAVVQPQEPDWYHKFTVTTHGSFGLGDGATWTAPSGDEWHRPSIFCDPANPASDAFSSPGFCQVTGGVAGKYYNLPPFFTRTLAINNTGKLQVTVRLYDKSDASVDNQPISETTREFDVSTYRISMNPNPPTAGYTLRDAFAVHNLKDSLGRTWNEDIPMRANDCDDGRLGNSNLCDNDGARPDDDMWSVMRLRQCPAGILDSPNYNYTVVQSAVASLEPPYNRLLRLDYDASCTSFAQGLIYRFKLTPGTYQVNLHFTIPASAADPVDVGSGCNAAAANTSCMLADTQLTTVDSGGLETTQSTHLSYDVYAASGLESTSGGALVNIVNSPKTAVFHTQVEIPDRTNEFRVYIKPMAASGTRFFLSGIEVSRNN